MGRQINHQSHSNLLTLGGGIIFIIWLVSGDDALQELFPRWGALMHRKFHPGVTVQELHLYESIGAEKSCKKYFWA